MVSLQCCQGAFGAHPGHDAHLLTTLSAIQILHIHDAIDRVNVSRVVSCTDFTYPIILLIISINYLMVISHTVPSKPIWIVLG